jgi:hypothetical protein
MTLRPSSDVVSRRVGDNVVLISLSTNRIYELNVTGARLWELMNSGSTPDTMVGQLVREFDVTPDNATAELDTLMTLLRKEGLVIET